MRASVASLLIIMMAAAGVASGCASTTSVPRPRPFPSPDWNRPSDRPREPVPPPAPSTPASPVASSDVTAPAPASSAALSIPFAPFSGRSIAEFALGFRGVPYRLGGADPAGFDCSGLVQYVFARYGVFVPRVVDEQYQFGQTIKADDVEPGDLLFFATNGRGATHVAIAVGENRFVHAPNSAGVVRVEALTSTYWSSHYIGARRVPSS
jgi:cell wall-associated NlpC family hydrolase